MFEERTNYDIDPAQTIMNLFVEKFGKGSLKMVIYFLSPTKSLPQLFSLKYDQPHPIYKKAGVVFPDRTKIKEKVKIQTIDKIPITIQAELNPQKTLLPIGINNNFVLTLRFFNPQDKNWDFVYILLDKRLQDSIDSKISAVGFKSVLKLDDSIQNVKSYFILFHSFLEDYVKIEYKKVDYIKELISTLEKSIAINNQRKALLDNLTKDKKTDLVTKVTYVLQKKSKELKKEINFSKEALDFIFHFTGEEKRLVKAIEKSVEVTNIISFSKGLEQLTIENEIIQIHLTHDSEIRLGYKQKRLERAEMFLNKYEEAAQFSENIRKDINIQAIAFHSKPSVSPPAVSSSISKYRNEMMSLLETKKSKWIILRTKFSPISSLIIGDEKKNQKIQHHKKSHP